MAKRINALSMTMLMLAMTSPAFAGTSGSAVTISEAVRHLFEKLVNLF